MVFPREEEHPIHEQEPPVSSHKWNQACLEDVPPTSKGKWRLIGIHIHYTYKGKSRLIGIHIHYTYHRNPTIWKSSTTERCSLSSIPMSRQKAQRLNLSICRVRKLHNQRISASSHPETSQKNKQQNILASFKRCSINSQLSSWTVWNWAWRGKNHAKTCKLAMVITHPLRMALGFRGGGRGCHSRRQWRAGSQWSGRP